MIIYAMTGLTIAQIYELAKEGDPVAWQNLSGAAGDNNEAKTYLLRLEKAGIKPRLQPNLPDIDQGILFNMPLTRVFSEIKEAIKELKA